MAATDGRNRLVFTVSDRIKELISDYSTLHETTLTEVFKRLVLEHCQPVEGKAPKKAKKLTPEEIRATPRTMEEFKSREFFALYRKGRSEVKGFESLEKFFDSIKDDFKLDGVLHGVPQTAVEYGFTNEQADEFVRKVRAQRKAKYRAALWEFIKTVTKPGPEITCLADWERQRYEEITEETESEKDVTERLENAKKAFEAYKEQQERQQRIEKEQQAQKEVES